MQVDLYNGCRMVVVFRMWAACICHQIADIVKCSMQNV